MALSRISLVNPVLFRRIPRFSLLKTATISTSDKSKDSLAIPEEVFPKKLPPPPKTVEDFAETKSPKNWISYGYDYDNYEEDRLQHKEINFLMISVFLCGGTFLYAYAPDVKQKDWNNREAYLELHRREKLGLPLIDKNFIDPSKIELPSDEELGDTEIII